MKGPLEREVRGWVETSVGRWLCRWPGVPAHRLRVETPPQADGLGEL